MPYSLPYPPYLNQGQGLILLFVKILFRGVRELKRVQLLPVDHPHIMVDCSGQMRISDRIVDMTKSCNFETYLKVIDLVRALLMMMKKFIIT